MHLRSLPAWTPWPPWPTFRRYRELSGSRLASLPRGPTLPSEVPWPPTPSLSGRLHVHDPSLSFSDFTPSTCLALFKVRSEISASRALFLIALADTGSGRAPMSGTPLPPRAPTSPLRLRVRGGSALPSPPRNPY